MAKTIADLFAPQPYQWGLRGDVWLWQDMCERLAGAPLPATAAELKERIEALFAELCGVPVTHPEPFFLEKYAHGGMSSGMVSPEFWRERGIPLLLAHYSEG